MSHDHLENAFRFGVPLGARISAQLSVELRTFVDVSKIDHDVTYIGDLSKYPNWIEAMAKLL